MSYWYLSLAHFLHSGDTLKSWSARDRGHETPLFEPLWVGRAWRTADWWAWNAYYSGTNGDFGEHEICDCYREPCFTKCKPPTYVGTRHFRLGRDGTAAGLITLMPFLGTAIRPRWNTLDEAGWTLGCNAHMEKTRKRRCAAGSAPAHDLANVSNGAHGALDAVAAEFQPDIMLMGLISNWPDSSVDSKQLCRFVHRYGQGRLASDLTIRVWVQLKTGDWNFGRSAAARRLVNATEQCGGSGLTDHQLLAPALVTRLMLATKRRSDVFLDNVHFRPWVYHELSQLLMNVLAQRL